MKKFIAIALLIVVIVSLFAVCAHRIVELKKLTDFDGDGYTVETYIVDRGDTLWNICEDVCGNDVPIREWIFAVKELNGLETSNLEVEQRLLVYVPVPASK